MSKRIIFCADGTWQTPQSQTNVYKLFKALPVTADQMPFYDDGVGADGTPLEKLIGGAIGDGLFQKIKDGYTKISHVYEQGDDVFVFGFSRGAYTARCIAGMIAACGLPTEAFDDNLVETAFQAYRDKDQRSQLLSSLNAYGLFDAKIKMVGVWDTVGALGIPAIFGGIDLIQYGFLDTTLHPDVLNAFQALAIDERRQQFSPTLWTSQPVSGQVLEQIWFAGCHGDVGGGGSYLGLADVSLGWMMRNARALGVEFDDHVWNHYSSVPLADALAQIDDSWRIFWGIPNPRQISANANLSNSVVIRCQSIPAYRPVNLTFTGGLPAETYPTVQIIEEGARPGG
jgi:uncharacterized protein (DUF2235 family)